jgi:translin
MKEATNPSFIENQEHWNHIVSTLRVQMEDMHQVREQALPLCRLLIQTSAKSIKHILREQFEEAKFFLDEARSLCKRVREILGRYPFLYYFGYLQDAEKELVEASILYAIVRELPYPAPADLDVHVTSYINGTVEAASECRRYVLDKMRQGDFELAERLIYHMEMIYEEMLTLDYADALTGGLRRSCDALRAVLERTRNDWFVSLMQRELVDELHSMRRSLQKEP